MSAPPAPPARTEAPLGRRIPASPIDDPERILALFLDWAAEAGFDLFPAQEEALLELMAGKHVVLQTPTGSGKSLVATGLIFKALCEGKTAWYTSPIKALASEKFFDFCDLFGAERVGMSTGDASINSGAGLICCTAEVLSNMALRLGDRLGVADAILDEFHYYSDAERGVAWQIPLVVLRRTRFLLMSATLGDVTDIAKRLERQTATPVAHVQSDHRPVPLDWEYRETPISETIGDLLADGKGPLYVVNFTQRACGELAQALTSLDPASKAQRQKIAEKISGFRFDTPYGRELRRLLRFGIGVHHAGLLPKYRLLVEQLSQEGLLSVIAGTDTLGVGVNVPIRTVLFTGLAKFDGEKTRILSVRDFKQIAGRAGRKGFDDRGSVVCQAPDWDIERKKKEKKGKGDGKRMKKGFRVAPPEGAVGWSVETFTSLIRRPPETLKSRFRITHGAILQLLQHDEEADVAEERNFASIRRLIDDCHEDEGRKGRLLREAALLVRSLHRAGIVRMKRDTKTRYLWAVVNPDLQIEFSLHQALSLYLVETITRLDPGEEGYDLKVLSLVEAILEDPRAILYRQVDKAKDDAMRQMKAEGVPYEERMAKLEEISWPRPPDTAFIFGTFEGFRQMHPWIGQQDIRPKSIAREMVEGYFGFNDYVRHHGLQRSEGLLLRYLSQLWKTMKQNVPEGCKTDGLIELEGYFRTLIERTDSSLLEEWESLVLHDLKRPDAGRRHERHLSLELAELLSDRRAFAARVRAEMHQLVRALRLRDWEEAVASVRPSPDDPVGEWTPERFEAAMEPFFAAHGELVFDAAARFADKTILRPDGHRRWKVSQILCDPGGENTWSADAEIDLTGDRVPEGPLVVLRAIGE